MKPPGGYAQPRRKAAPKKQVRLNLRRAASPPPPGDELGHRQRSNFWKWFVLVALLHLLVFTLVLWHYRPAATPPPPEFISLVPEGDTVKGTPGTQAAPKIGATTPAPAHHQSTTPTPPEPPQTAPPPSAVVEPPSVAPKPVIHDETAPSLAQAKPKPKKPPKPKVKVDLHLADGPMPAAEKPVKPKHHKKPVQPPADDRQDARDAADSDNMGLSKEQIAARLGDKLKAAGIDNATQTGVSGSHDSHASEFSDFYASIHDQVMNKWENPNIADPQAVNPVIQIHVEKDGRVPVEGVTLLQSSGNPTIDDSALAAARSLGYLLQPLPDRCPPDISITFKLAQ
jgi:TonB family protein